MRRFGSANSALVDIAKYMNTLFEYKTKYQEEEVAKIKSMLFQAIARYTLRKSEKTYGIILSSIRLNQRNHFAEG